MVISSITRSINKYFIIAFIEGLLEFLLHHFIGELVDEISAVSRFMGESSSSRFNLISVGGERILKEVMPCQML